MSPIELAQQTLATQGYRTTLAGGDLLVTVANETVRLPVTTTGTNRLSAVVRGEQVRFVIGLRIYADFKRAYTYWRRWGNRPLATNPLRRRK